MTFPNDTKVSLTPEHHHALDQLLGRKAARELYLKIAHRFPCTYCGAKVGDVCVTDTGAATAYAHGARRHESHAAWQREVWELANPIVEERRANREATMPVKLPSVVVTRRLRPRIVIDPDYEDRTPLGVQLGIAAARVTEARAREERAWLDVNEATLELLDAERELSETAKRLGLTDTEALLR